VTLQLDGYDFGGSGGDGSTSTLQPGGGGGAAGSNAPPSYPPDASDATSNGGGSGSADTACAEACALPHATPDCSDAGCAIRACAGPWRDTNGVAADGCESGDVPRDALGLWFLADDGVVAQLDGSISTWSDRSGNGTDASQPALAQRPALEVRPDGMPMLSFDGTNDSLALPPGFATFDGASFFAVVEALPNPRCAGLLHLSNGPDLDDVEFGRHQTNLLYYEVVDDFINGTTEGFVTDRRLVVSIVQAGPGAETPGRVELRIDGSLDQVDVVRLPAAVERRVNYLGQNAYTRQPALCSAYFRGRMGEVIFYARGLAADERARVEAYLREKWQPAAPR
jgi:hypothetical protein